MAIIHTEQIEQWRKCIKAYVSDEINNIQCKENNDVLDIGRGSLSKYLKQQFPKILVADRPQNRIPCDIHLDVCEQVPDEQYDVIFCLEVLEHTLAPWKAAPNLLAMLKPNGLLVISVPCLFHYHPGGGHYGDYWRFMPSHIPLLFGNDVSIVRSKVYPMQKETAHIFPLGMCYTIKKRYVTNTI